MSSIGSFSVDFYCQCGATMNSTGVGNLEAVYELSNIFWSIHDGGAHGSATRQEAANARRRLGRQQAKAFREQRGY